MNFKNIALFNTEHSADYEQICDLRDAAANTSITILPIDARVVLFTGALGIVYVNDGSHPAEISRVTGNNNVSLADGFITIEIPSIETTNTIVDFDTDSYISNILPVSIVRTPANTLSTAAYYEIYDIENCVDIIHSYAIIDNGSLTFDSNKEKMIMVLEISSGPRGRPYNPGFTITGTGSLPLHTSGPVTIESTGKVFVIAIEYNKNTP